MRFTLALLLFLVSCRGPAPGDPAPAATASPPALPSSSPAPPPSASSSPLASVPAPASAVPASSVSEDPDACLDLAPGAPTAIQLGALGRGVRGVDVSRAAP